MLIGATNPSWITSEVQALERVALTAPIMKRKISRLLSIHLFKKGPTSTTEKMIVSPKVSVLLSIGVVSMTSAVLEAIQMPSFFSPRPSVAEKTNLAIIWKYLGAVDKVRKIHFLGASIWPEEQRLVERS